MWYANRLLYLLCISSTIQTQEMFTGLPGCCLCGSCTNGTSTQPSSLTPKPPPPPEWIEPHCMDAVGGKFLVSIPVRYYRKSKIQAVDKRKCLQYCAEESSCKGVEWFDNQCYDIQTTYEKGIIPTEGPVKYKGFTCFTISSPLKRLKRTYTTGRVNKWNADNRQNSGICMLATNAAQGCKTMVKVGSHDNDRKLQLNGPNFAGYCMQTPGDCGATELVVRYYRFAPNVPNWYWTILKPDYDLTYELTSIYRYEDTLCYVWPGYPDINCSP